MKFKLMGLAFTMAIVTNLCLPAKALLRLGSGFSTAMSGRTVPHLYVGLEGQSFGASFTSMGVHSKHTASSYYHLNLFWLKEMKDTFLFGTIQLGFGVGATAHFLHFIDADGDAKKGKNGTFGPAFRVFSEYAGFLFYGIEASLGMRNLNIIVLSTQHVANLVVGFHF